MSDKKAPRHVIVPVNKCGNVEVIGIRGDKSPEVRFNFGTKVTGPFICMDTKVNGSINIRLDSKGDPVCQLICHQGFNELGESVPKKVEKAIEVNFLTAFNSIRKNEKFLAAIEIKRHARNIKKLREEHDLAKATFEGLSAKLTKMETEYPESVKFLSENPDIEVYRAVQTIELPKRPEPLPEADNRTALEKLADQILDSEPKE